MDSSTIIFTGFRPTGDLHLGHYFSFIKPLIDILHNTDHHIFILIADLHSLTELRKNKAKYDNISEEIVNHTIDNIRTILRFIPKKYYDRLVIFRQSDLETFHLRLFYRLLMISKNSMTLGNPVFKDAMRSEIDTIIDEFDLDEYNLNLFNSIVTEHPQFLLGNINDNDHTLFDEMLIPNDSKKYIIKRINSRSGILGMACYPILMASDIILYEPQAVLIGSDQEPHLQITNDMIRTINSTFDVSVELTSAMVLSNVTFKGSDGKKMSKTLKNYISINDILDTDKGKKWFTSMKTFPRLLKECGNPDECPVGNWYKNINMGQDIMDLCRSASIGCVACKKQLYEYVENNIMNNTSIDKISDDIIIEVLSKGSYRAYQRIHESKEIQRIIH